MMTNRWSWKLGEYAGIGVYLHWTFFIVPALVAFSTLGSGGLAAAIEAVVFVLAIFGCVVLHEYGHALMARRFGIATRDITLYPIGGIARLDRIPERPGQELLVALAGPAVNVVIAAILLGFIVLSVAAGALPTAIAAVGTFVGNLLMVNIALVVFNMLPAFPMDGGRVLRSILAMNMPYVRATDIAAKVGQTLAIVLGISGVLYGNVSLMLIGLFVYFAAGAEANQARTRPVSGPYFEQRPKGAPYQSLSTESRLGNVADALLLSPQHVFPVMAGTQFVGTLVKGDILRAVSEGLGHWTVGDLMQSR